jgi:hypothetical protein
MSRGGHAHDSMFGPDEPQDAIPEIEDLLEAEHHRRQSNVRGLPRPAHPRHRLVGRVLLVFRIAFYVGLLAVGLIAVAAGTVDAVSQYGQASDFAAAPACPATVDVENTTADCVGHVTGDYLGALSQESGSENQLTVSFPPLTGPYFNYAATFPANAAFSKAVQRSAGAVTGEFWHGRLVALSVDGATDSPATVTTDANPNNEGGGSVGVALMGFAFALFAILLVFGIRAFRYRYASLRPGLGLRMAVSAMITAAIGAFIAACVLINQPSSVVGVGIYTPAIVIMITALTWLLVIKSRKTTRTRQAWSGTR